MRHPMKKSKTAVLRHQLPMATHYDTQRGLQPNLWLTTALLIQLKSPQKTKTKSPPMKMKPPRLQKKRQQRGRRRRRSDGRNNTKKRWRHGQWTICDHLFAVSLVTSIPARRNSLTRSDKQMYKKVKLEVSRNKLAQLTSRPRHSRRKLHRSIKTAPSSSRFLVYSSSTLPATSPLPICEVEVPHSATSPFSLSTLC